MCEANAYLVSDDGSEELVLERVDTVVPHEAGLMLCSIFGHRKFVKAKIKELALVDHKIILESRPQEN